MSKKNKTYGGILRWDNINKKIFVTRELNPPSYNARFLHHLKLENPDYEIIKEY